MSKSDLIIDTPEHCYLCTCYTEDEGDGYCLGITAKRVPTEGKPSWCPLKPYKKVNAIPIEWLHSIMERQLIFAMNSEMEGTTTVKDGVIHCVSGALACQVLANVIELWEKEKEEEHGKKEN